MIRIIYDALKLTTPTPQNIIKDVGEYPAAYAAVLIALHSKNDLRYTVYLSPVLQWLKNLSLRYPQGDFVFKTLDALQALAHCRGMDIPTSITNEDFFRTRLFATTDIVESSLSERNINGLLPVCG